jgi:hypothetical protein
MDWTFSRLLFVRPVQKEAGKTRKKGTNSFLGLYGALVLAH